MVWSNVGFNRLGPFGMNSVLNWSQWLAHHSCLLSIRTTDDGQTVLTLGLATGGGDTLEAQIPLISKWLYKPTCYDFARKQPSTKTNARINAVRSLGL